MPKVKNWQRLMPVQVYCKECEKWMSEDKVEFLNIEEDFYGRDKMAFRCPFCSSVQKSLRRG